MEQLKRLLDEFSKVVEKQIKVEQKNKKKKKNMEITQNGRPMGGIGNLYWEKNEIGMPGMKFFICYCPECKKKIGITKQEVESLSSKWFNSKPVNFLKRLSHIRIYWPK